MSLRGAAMACMSLAILSAPALAEEVPRESPGREPLYRLEGDPVEVEDQGAVVGRQGIVLDPDVLDGLMAFAKRAGEALEVDLLLFGGVRETVRFDSVSRTGSNEFMLTGHSVARPDDLVVLLVFEGRLGGRLNVGDEHYLIRSFGARHYLLKLDPGLLPPSAPPTFPKPSPSQGTADEVPEHAHAPRSCQPEDPKQISLLVLYTRAARIGAEQADPDAGELNDSTPSLAGTAIRDDVLSAVGAANAALTHSLAVTRFQTEIPVEEIDTGYAETGDGYLTLDQLYTAGHPLHVAASARRAALQANLVVLVIEHWQAACGAAPVMIDWLTHPDQTAYSVVRRTCLEGEMFSLAHELAHSMGNAHDHPHAGVPGLFAFSYGYNAADYGLSTIMAYSCAGCVRKKSYSNPAGHFPETTTPSGEQCASTDPACRQTDNVQSIDRAACQVATWH